MRLRGIDAEANRILRALMESLGVEASLLLWLAITLLLGAAMALGVPWSLELGAKRARLLTIVDKAILDAYGVEGASKIILATALGLGAVGPVLNAICLLRSVSQ